MVSRLVWIGVLLGGLTTGMPEMAAAQDRRPVPPPHGGDTLRIGPDAGNLRLQRALDPMLLERFRYRRARLGLVVNFRAVDSDTIGALITAVTPGGPGARAGVEAGDLVLRFNGTQLVDRELATRDPEESVPGLRLIELAARMEPNDTVRLDLQRGQVRRTVNVVAEEEPGMAVFSPLQGGGFVYRWRSEAGDQHTERLDQPRAALDLALRRMERDHVFEVAPPPGLEPRMRMELFRGPLTDLELATVNPQLGSYFGTTEGILVVRVAEGSPLKLQAGDVVLTIDGRTPTSPAQLLRILRTYDDGEAITFNLMRQKKHLTVTGYLAQPKRR